MKNIQLAVLAFVAALAAQSFAAIQYWNPTGTANTAGDAAWDTSVDAWATSNNASATPVPWVDGNDAWFTLNDGTSTVTVNSPVVQQMYFNNGYHTFNPGTGPLYLHGPITNNNDRTKTFNTDIVLLDDQTWHLGGNVIVNGAITGGKSLRRTHANNLTISNELNNLSGLWAEFGGIIARGGGNVLGGPASEIKLGSPRQARSSSFALENMTDRGITEWYAGDLVANGYGEFGVTRNPDNNTVSNIINFAGTLRRENKGAIQLNQYGGNSDGSAQIWFHDLDPALLGPGNQLPVWFYTGGEPLYVSPEGWVKQYSPVNSWPWTDPAVFYQTGTARTMDDNAAVYAARIGHALTIPQGFSLTNASGQFVMHNHIYGDGDIDLGDKEAVLMMRASVGISPKINTTGGLTLFGGSVLTVPDISWSGETRIHNAYLRLENADDVVWDMTSGDLLGPPLSSGPESGLRKFGAGKLTIQNAAAAQISRFEINEGDIEIKNSRFASRLGGVGLNQDGMTFTITNSIYRFDGDNFRTATGRNNISVEVYGSGNPAQPTIVYGRGGTDNYLYPEINGHGIRIGNEGHGNSLLIDGKGVTGGAVWTNMVYNRRGIAVGSNVGSSNNVARIIGGGEVWDEVTTNNEGNMVGNGINASGNRIEVIGGEGFVSKLVKYYGNVIGNGVGADRNEILVDGRGVPGSAVFEARNVLTSGAGGGRFNRLTVKDGGEVFNLILTVGNNSNENLVEITGAGSLVNGNAGNSVLSVGVNNATNNVLYVADGGELLFSGAYQTAVGGNGGGDYGVGHTVNNKLIVGPGGYFWNNKQITIGRVSGVTSMALNNQILVTGENARLRARSNSEVHIGSANNGASAIGNELRVENGGDVFWDRSEYNYHPIYVGVVDSVAGSDSRENRIVAENGGHVYFAGQIYVGQVNGDNVASNNYVLATANGVIEADKLEIRADAGNTISAQNGGVLQFSTKTPTITPITHGNIFIDNAVLGYTATGAVDIRNDHLNNDYNNILWTGNNGVRLSGITLPTSYAQSYTFEHNVSPTNWAFLQMVGGETVYRTSAGDPVNLLKIGMGTGTLATMLVSNTNARVEMPFEMNGELTVVNAELAVTQAADINGDIVLKNGHITFAAGADITGVVIIDADAADPENLPSITGSLNLGAGFIIRAVGEIIDGKPIARIDAPASGSLVFDKSNLPPNYSYRYGVEGEGVVSAHYYDPTTLIIIK